MVAREKVLGSSYVINDGDDGGKRDDEWRSSLSTLFVYGTIRLAPVVLVCQ